MGRIASTWASATRLRWPPLKMARKPVAEAGEIEPLEPCFRLGERLAALHAVEGQAERDVARRLPRQQGIVLEQDADLRRRKLVSTVPDSGCCSPITARSRLDLPEPEARPG